MKFKQFLNEKKVNLSIEKVKREIEDLKKTKLTALGKRRLENLENYLIKYGIFHF